jgi:glycosyltransferase involved in cell wall biosynthesis
MPTNILLDVVKKNFSISVCMATFNGESFVAQQVLSILEQLGKSDELIIVDDCSSDRTVEVLRQINDPRIFLFENQYNQREVFSFNRAIYLARNDIIFLTDQDDIWIPGRLMLMTKNLIESGADVVSSNFKWIDALGLPIQVKVDGVTVASSRRYFSNVIDIFLGKTNYYGCAMAFRRKFNSIILPIPRFVESHDLWIAMASNLAGSNAHIDEPTLLKRQHSNNATSPVSKRKLYRKLWSRVIFGVSLMLLLYRVCAVRGSVRRWRAGRAGS